jgi:glycosyltransferase involved in cell wall biosynthesis
MGRIARPVVRAACDDPTLALTLLADGGDDRRALREEFAGVDVRAVGRERYDVAWFPFNGIRRAARAPAVVSIADAFAFTEPHRDPVARFREQTPIRRAARTATRVVTLSHWSRGEIARELRLPVERIDVVVPAPDAFWFPGFGDPLPEGIAGNRFALLVGAREPRKNARLAIDACARALRGPDELLVVVGSLDDADRAYARASGVRCGEIAASDAVLRALYRSARAVLVPSLAEGFGLVTVEAMACGAPVLAASTSALPEAAAGAATLLDPLDPIAWATALRELLDGCEVAEAARVRGLARVASIDRAEPARRILGLLRDVALATVRS